jgi:hypothetical protein
MNMKKNPKYEDLHIIYIQREALNIGTHVPIRDERKPTSNTSINKNEF